MRTRLGLIGTLVVLGASLGVVGAPPAPAAGPCTTTVNGGTWSGVLIVPSGETCILNGVTVTGSVSVQSGASFESCLGTIQGGLSAYNPAYINVEGTVIGGSVSIDQPQAAAPTAAVIQCQPTGSEYYSVVLCPASVGGSITISNAPKYSGEIEVGDDCPFPGIDPVKGAVNILNNLVEVTVAGSVIWGNLICRNNDPQAESEDNTFPHGGRVDGCVIETEE